jgi:hypothetical protein
LLFVQKDKMVYERPQLREDLAYEQARTTLIALLRQPADTDLSGDGTSDPATLADALVAKKFSEEELKTVLETRLPDQIPWIAKVSYPDGSSIKADHVESIGWITRIFTLTGSAESLIEARAPRASVQLPGGATVELLYADRPTIEYLLSYKGERTKEQVDSDVSEIMRQNEEETK